MTIRRGADWGESVTAPSDLTITDDAGAGRAVREALTTGATPPAIGLRSGDLARTMGGGHRDIVAGRVVRAPVDVLEVVDPDVVGASTIAAAHVVARRRWWRGEVWIGMNAQFIGRFDVAPRSHPNDGLVDVLHVDASMPLRARLAARRRARTGAHLPHPSISTARSRAAEVTFRRPLDVYIDGVRWRRVARLVVRVRPDAVVVHV